MNLKRNLLIVFLIVIVGYSVLCIIFFFYQEKLIFHPEPLPTNYKFSYEEPFREVNIKTLDGEQINALHFKADNSKGVVLYFHGNAGNLSQWGSVASQFLPYQYDLFIMDYRGYGKSTGSFNEYKLYQDALSCYQYLIDTGFQARDIFIYGRSIGTGIASRVGNEKWNKGVILESPLNNMTDLANHYMPFLPNGLLLRYKFRVGQYVTHIRQPVYIIHGTHDEIIPYELAVKLKDKSDKVTFFTIEEGGHNNLSSFPEFDEIMESIFTK